MKEEKSQDSLILLFFVIFSQVNSRKGKCAVGANNCNDLQDLNH
jgi:hypothetical protein